MPPHVSCPYCGTAQSATPRGDDPETTVACCHCARDFVPNRPTQPPEHGAEQTIRAINVFCPRCGASRSAVIHRDYDVEPTVDCFACAEPFFASEATQPPAPNRIRVLRPIDTVCPHCGAEGEIDAPSAPAALAQCFACGKRFAVSEHGRPREPRRRAPRRRRRQPLTQRELRELTAGRTFTPAVLLAVFAAVQLCAHVSAACFVLWEAFVVPGPPNPDRQLGLLICGIVLFLFLLKDVLILTGVRALEQRHGYSRAVVASACALVPDIGWLFSVGLAIWVLVVLTDPDVRAAFDAASSPGSATGARNGSDWRADGRAAVALPAVLLLIGWVIGVCLTLGLVATTVVQFQNGKLVAGERYWLVAYSVAATVATCVGLAGACSALSLRRHGLAVASAVLMCVCLGVTVIGLGVGLWCLGVFYRADVMAAFGGTTRTGRSVRSRESAQHRG